MTEIMLQHTPSNWQRKRLGQLFRERREKVSDKDFPPLSVTKQGILPQLETAAKTDDGDNRKGVRAGDFVINSRSDRKGSGGLSDRDGSVSLINIVLQPRDVEPRFAHHLLRSPAFQEEFYRWGHGIVADLWTTRYSEMKNILLAVPSRTTQTAIADFLDRETARIDQLIEKKQQLVALLPEKEKNEISRLVMRGSDPSVACRDTGIFWRGPVPAHWTESRLKAHFRIQKRQGFDKLTVLSVYREYGVIEKSSRDDNINKTPEDLSKYQLVEPGDLVINKMKAWQGSLGVSSLNGITSPDYVVMIPCAQHHPQYMHHLLRAVPMPTVYHLISNGIRTDQWRMEPNRFLSLPVFLPPMDEQEQIARKVDEELAQLRNIADTINASIGRLKEYRSALITAAVTGQIDVATWGKQGRTDRRLDEIEEAMQT